MTDDERRALIARSELNDAAKAIIHDALDDVTRGDAAADRPDIRLARLFALLCVLSEWTHPRARSAADATG